MGLQQNIVCRTVWGLELICVWNRRRDRLTLVSRQTAIRSLASWTQMLAKLFFNGSKLWHSILWINQNCDALYEWRLTSSQQALWYLEYIHPSNLLKTSCAKLSHSSKNTQSPIPNQAVSKKIIMLVLITKGNDEWKGTKIDHVYAQKSWQISHMALMLDMLQVFRCLYIQETYMIAVSAVIPSIFIDIIDINDKIW